MTLADYKENYDGAPFHLYEFAEGARDVTDCPELSEAGKAYLAAMEHMEEILAKYDIEVG